MLGAIRFAELRDQERPLVAGFYGALGVIALVVAAGAVLSAVILVD